MTDASRAKPIVPIQAVAAVFAVVFMFAWPGPWNLERWIGISIAVPAAFCLVLARYQLGASFSVSPQARELVTRGLYSKIRNPIYVFGGLMVLGFLLVLQIPQAFALFLVLVPMQLIRARRESRVLEAKFGEAYLEYKRNTWF